MSGPRAPPSYFEQQRAAILEDVAKNMELVLQNINKLNRSLEGVIAVGNEFGSVEALWSQFEGVMARDPEADAEAYDVAGEEVEDEHGSHAGEEHSEKNTAR